jgi:hypothetical protein
LFPQESDSKDNKYFLDTLYQDYFYKDVDRRVHAYGVKVGYNNRTEEYSVIAASLAVLRQEAVSAGLG